MKDITATQVCAKLNVSTVTLTNWYRYYNDPKIDKPKDMPPLPQYEQSGPRATRYWDKDDIRQIRKFQKWIPKGRGGVMGEVSKSFWGARGKKKTIGGNKQWQN